MNGAVRTAERPHDTPNFVGREREYSHIEKMANVDELPRHTGVPLVTFPVTVHEGSAGWARPVAFVE